MPDEEKSDDVAQEEVELAEDSKNLESIEVRSVAELVEALSARPEGETVWYRGHSDASHELIPSLARAPRNVDAEQTLLKRFKQNAYPFLKVVPESEWEWLFLMQHHGVPQDS